VHDGAGTWVDERKTNSDGGLAGCLYSIPFSPLTVAGLRNVLGPATGRRFLSTTQNFGHPVLALLSADLDDSGVDFGFIDFWFFDFRA